MFLGAGHQENDGFVGTPRQTGGRLQPPQFLGAGRRLSLVTGSLIKNYGT